MNPIDSMEEPHRGWGN